MVMQTAKSSKEDNAQDEKLITLNVSGRHFVTFKETLTSGSDWFANRLSGRWNDRLTDGSYFVDADPDLFAYILQYLRRETAPLFYTQGGGHEYGKYTALLREADYLQVTGLKAWLEAKRYHEAVKVITKAQKVEELESIDRCVSSDWNVKHHPHQAEKKTYVCPRDIQCHRGQRWRCGTACAKAEAAREGDMYEIDYVTHTVVISSQVSINEEQLYAG